MSAPRHIAVIDIGKTNAKLALVDLATMSEVAVLTRPNAVRPGPPWPHFDTEGHWAFLLDALGQFHRSHGIDGISITTHGASIVLLDARGDLAAPILDYEHDGPVQTAVQYDAIRPAFAETGSPRLANGLNVGAQPVCHFLREDVALFGRRLEQVVVEAVGPRVLFSDSVDDLAPRSIEHSTDVFGEFV